MKKRDRHIEHYCIPLAFLLLNCCIIHFLFLMAAANKYAGFYQLAVAVAGLALIITIVRKMKWGMLLACFIYAVLLLYAIFASNAAAIN